MLLRDVGFALMVALFPVAVVPLCIVAEWLAKMIHWRRSNVVASTSDRRADE
jgi:hypothetical protein